MIVWQPIAAMVLAIVVFSFSTEAYHQVLPCPFAPLVSKFASVVAGVLRFNSGPAHCNDAGQYWYGETNSSHLATCLTGFQLQARWFCEFQIWNRPWVNYSLSSISERFKRFVCLDAQWKRVLCSKQNLDWARRFLVQSVDAGMGLCFG
eukprot:jgi/Botrbrau1/16596/Bobra.0068s0026.1